MRPRTRASAAALVALLAACGAGSESSAATDDVLAEEEIDVPTPEEAAADAEARIDEGNADAELERLEQEIGREE